MAPELLTAPEVRIDLTQVSFIDSTTIGFLVAACKKERSAGGIFSLRCSEGPVFRVLEVSGLIDFFKVEVVA